MRIIIAGSRTIHKFDIADAVKRSGFDITTLINGRCPTGIDKLASDWAKSVGIPIEYYPANFKELGKKGGPLRNKEMAKLAFGLILVWDGHSKGSKSMKEEAEKAKLFIYEIITTN